MDTNTSTKKRAAKGLNKRPGYYSGYYMIRLPTNKLKRILRHNGLSAAREWASKNEVTGLLTQLIKQGVKVRE